MHYVVVKRATASFASPQWQFCGGGLFSTQNYASFTPIKSKFHLSWGCSAKLLVAEVSCIPLEEAIERPLFGSGDMVAMDEMLSLEEVSQTFGDNRPMEVPEPEIPPPEPGVVVAFVEGRGGWDDGRGGGREQGRDGGPEGIGEVVHVGVIMTELGRHFTVTMPVGSDRNHSERWRILSVCLW